MTRAERAAEAARLRWEGLLYREIAERMGISMSYAAALITDPKGKADRDRKKSYGGVCGSCGARTDGSNGRVGAPAECAECHHRRQHEERRWTSEAIAEAMRGWDQQHGPPSPDEWRTAGPDHPSTTTVVREVGWGNALRLAGLPTREFVTPSRSDPFVKERAASLYRAGLSLAEVAEHFGVTPTAVRYWLIAVDQVRRPALRPTRKVAA